MIRTGPISEQIKKFKKRIGRNVKMIRTNSGLTAEEFASWLNISRSHLFRLETAQANSIDFCLLYNLGKQTTDLDRLFREDIEKIISQRNKELFLNRKESKKWKE